MSLEKYTPVKDGKSSLYVTCMCYFRPADSRYVQDPPPSLFTLCLVCCLGSRLLCSPAEYVMQYPLPRRTVRIPWRTSSISYRALLLSTSWPRLWCPGGEIYALKIRALTVSPLSNKQTCNARCLGWLVQLYLSLDFLFQVPHMGYSVTLRAYIPY